jgi:hypothetical protein
MKCHCYGKPAKKKKKGDEEGKIEIQTKQNDKGKKGKRIYMLEQIVLL